MPVQTHKKWAQLTTRHGIFRFALCVVSRNPSADFLFTWIAAERGLCPWPGDTRCGDKQPSISICKKKVSLTKKDRSHHKHTHSGCIHGNSGNLVSRSDPWLGSYVITIVLFCF